jgi:WD40 repeat protein
MSGAVLSVAFSPDGKTVATGNQGGTVKLWSTATRQEILVLKGHSGRVHAVAFSPDGSLLASGSEDTTVKLWRTASFTETDAMG